MTQTYYDIYLDEVLALTRSIVIKNRFIAEAINKTLKTNRWIVLDEQPHTWKYYLNISGQYHASDAMMTVKSLDTQETINFTQENLLIHRATAREVKPGSVYYNSLVKRYPLQADLINGIISPVDIQKAIDAQDGDILYFDPQYVESNEDTFVTDLQSWVKVFLTRNFNEQFVVIDDLYLPAVWGLLHGNLPKAIMSIRLRNCKTNRAHSFHIRQYLASNGELDAYIPYLTKEQQLFLYRNIQFLKRNAGMQFIWDRLVYWILTKRGIPLIDYTLQQNTEKMPDSLYPDVELVKRDINSTIVLEGYDKVDVDTLLTREQSLARDNRLVQYDTEQDILTNMRSSKFSSLPTKVLDSEVVDRGNSNIRSLEQILFNEWIHLSSSGRYRAYISVVNPSDGEYFSMTVKDALIVAMYTYCKTRDIPVDVIPEVIAYEVLRSPLPGFAELQSLVDPRYVPDKLIRAVMDRVTPLTEYISTEQFYTDCVNLHQEYLKLWELYSFQEHYMTRGLCEQVVRRHFMHVKVKLVDQPMSFEQYFDELGLNIATLGKGDMESLLNEILRVAVGANLVNVITLGEIQAQLLKLMDNLTAYPLQYLRNVSSTDYRQLGIPAIRVGDISVNTKGEHWANVIGVDAIRYRGTGRSEVVLPGDMVMPPISVDARTAAKYLIPTTVGFAEEHSSVGRYRINANSVGVRGFSYTTTDNPSGGELLQYDPS